MRHFLRLSIAKRLHDFSRGLKVTGTRCWPRRVATLEFQPSLRDGIFSRLHRGLKATAKFF